MKTESKRRDQCVKELPPFHAAARHGRKKELYQLLRNHPDLIDYGDSNGDTALMHAVLSKNAECMKILLEAGCKTDVKDTQGRTAILLSAAKGWNTGFELLASFKANCQATDENNRNALHFISCLDKTTCLRTVLTCMSIREINQKDVEGMTPLHWAAFHNLPENVELLLQDGADPVILDHEDKSPLHWASQNGCLEVCKLLLCTDACKSIINLRSQEGRSPLHLAAAAGHFDVLFELAQGLGCDVDSGDAEGRTALHWACAMGKYRCVAGLLRLGVPPNPVDNYGITPVAYAKQLNHSDCVSLFDMYDPKKPQRILIPMQDKDETMLECKRHNTSCDDAVNNAFSLSVSHENEQRQKDNIKSLHSQISNRTYNMQELKYALGEVLQENGFQDAKQNGQLYEPSMISVTENGHHSSKSSSCSESGSDVSEDESRYQAQMAISPCSKSPNSSPEFLAIDSRHEKQERKSSKNLQLAPIKGRISKQRTMEELNRLELSPLNLRASTDKMKMQRFSKHSMIGPKKPISEKESRDSPSLHVTSTTTTLLQRPLGLRRKSISLNDGLSQIEQNNAQKLHIVRTQSNGFIKTKQRKLPVITATGGRNLTQQWTNHIQIDDGYEGFDEKSFTSGDGIEMDKKKKRLKKRYKLKS